MSTTFPLRYSGDQLINLSYLNLEAHNHTFGRGGQPRAKRDSQNSQGKDGWCLPMAFKGLLYIHREWLD